MSFLKKSILAFVLAGGKGERLDPLTRERTKPSVPFGGKYRIIDFALSNLINSEIYSIYVLVQYKSQSLIEHIRTTWIREGLKPRHFITVVPPQMRREMEWYRGTADSIYQNINLIYDYRPQLVAIFSGDHVYRMDIRDMVKYHLEKKAQMTVAVNPIEASKAYQFGVVAIGPGDRVKGFVEKPHLSGKSKVFGSMGNYIFNTDFLIEVLEDDAKRKTSRDFGKDIVPHLVTKNSRAYAYDFSQNRVPSLKKYEAKAYWQDVGTIPSYWQANMDLLGRKPAFDLNNQHWPIYASNLNSSPFYSDGAKIENSVICQGSYIVKSTIRNSILGRSVTVGEDCYVENSIIMDFVHIKKGSRIRNAIVDRFNTFSRGARVGYNKKSDNKNYHRDPSGIIVVPRGPRKTFYY